MGRREFRKKKNFNKNKNKNKDGKLDDRDDPNNPKNSRVSFREIAKDNQAFQKYYKAQNLIKDDKEFQMFYDILKEPLPAGNRTSDSFKKLC